MFVSNAFASSLRIRLLTLLSVASIIFAGPLSHDSTSISASVPFKTNGRQRTATLNEYYLSGVRNVRWETMPMQTVDSNGKPIDASKVGGMKQADGTTSFGCVDAVGKNQPDGVEYERPNGHFKYRCNNGVEEVVACVGSNRTNKARIEVGKTLDVGGLWHKCQNFPNGSVVYTQETTCNSNGKEYKVGDEVQVGFLRLQCQDKGYSVVGCYYLDENNQAVALNNGEKREVGNTTHYCEDKGDTLQYFAKANGCTKQGKQYKDGEALSQGHLHYKCTNGLMDITGCYIDEKRDLSIGQDVVEKNTVYRCYRLGPSIHYNEYACGYNGTPSCQPEAIPQTPDEAPSLDRGLKAPGFGTFAVVQKTGTGPEMVVSPGTLKLELDKAMASK